MKLYNVMKYAIDAHEGQKYGKFPYIVHLIDVHAVLLEFNVKDQDILASAFLHDLLEDTEFHYSDVKKLFGHEIAEIVYAITDEKGRNRKERKDKTWPVLILNDKAVILKQADMIANIRMGRRENSDMVKMYREEYPAFKEYFKGHGLKEFWDELDKLCA